LLAKSAQQATGTAELAGEGTASLGLKCESWRSCSHQVEAGEGPLDFGTSIGLIEGLKVPSLRVAEYTPPHRLPLANDDCGGVTSRFVGAGRYVQAPQDHSHAGCAQS